MSRTNICFDRKKACGGCSWSAVDPETGQVRFEPVPGWDAKKVKLHLGDRRVTETYSIKACPQFEQEERRSNTAGEISDDEFRTLMAVWKWREEHGE